MRLVLCVSFLFLSACEKNNLEKAAQNCAFEINYHTAIAPLLETKCSISDCHVSQSTIGDFTSYNEVKKRVDNGKLKIFVFDLKNMPPGEPLSEKDLDKILCWMDQGAKE